jgi:hypothetical protein
MNVWFGLFSVGGYDYPIVATSEFMAYRIAGRIFSDWLLVGISGYDSFKSYCEYIGFRVEEMEINTYLKP